MSEPTKFYGGALFANRQKKPGEKTPDYRGDIELDEPTLRHLGQLFKQNQPLKLEIVGWVRDDKNGQPFVSVKLGIPRERTNQPAYVQPLPRQAPAPAVAPIRPKLVQLPLPMAPKRPHPAPGLNDDIDDIPF